MNPALLSLQFENIHQLTSSLIYFTAIAIYFYARTKDTTTGSYIHIITKCFPICILASYTAIYFLYYRTDYSFNILCGLVFCAVGDGLLAVDKGKETSHFIIGTISFGMGHIFYTISFSTQPYDPYRAFFIFIGLLFPFLLVQFWIIKKIKLQTIKFVCGCYSMLILFTIFNSFKMNGHSNLTWAKLGMTSFAISDILLGYSMFSQIINHSCKSVMITYYIAQYLIVMSIHG